MRDREKRVLSYPFTKFVLAGVHLQTAIGEFIMMTWLVHV